MAEHEKKKGAKAEPVVEGDVERFLDAIIENIPDMIFVKDAIELRFVRFNRAGEALLGIPREEMYGKNDHDFFPAAEADFFANKDREVLAGGNPVEIPVEPIQTATGEIRYLHTKKVPIYGADGAPSYLLGISEDITERKRAEEERARLLSLVSQSLDFVGLFNANGAAEYINPTGREMLGLTPDAGLDGVTMASCCPPRVVKYLQTVVVPSAEREGMWRGELPWRHAGSEGGEIITLALVQAHFNEERASESFSVSARDVSLEKEAERTLAAESVTLRALNERLAEADRVKSEFIARVSHELRTPLTLILAPLESMLAEELESLSAEQRQVLQTVHGNGVRLLQMINSLLDFAKLEAGRFSAEREPTDAGALTESILADFEPLLRRKNLDLQSDVDHVVVDLDRYLYERILYNLMSNAIKFTDEGGQVTVSARQFDGRWVLRVTDTGIGIAPEQQAALFGRFSQVEATTARRYEGTGLGLALVREFAQLLGGDAALISRPGDGTTVVVNLQAARSEQIAAPIGTPPPGWGAPTTLAARRSGADGTRRATSGPPGEATPPISPLASVPSPSPRAPSSAETGAVAARVLVAEDNPEMAAYIISTLRGIAECEHAADGEAAFALANEWKPDLVLSDVMMPVCTGIELCRRIKATPSLVGTPVVLVSALTQRDALQEGWAAGADEYLFKPFHPQELRARVGHMLDAVAKDHVIRRLRQVNGDLERFAHLVSHDLNAPIRTIAMYAELLQVEHANQLDAEAGEYVQRIRGGAQRLAQVVEDTVRLTDLGQQPLNLAAVNLKVAVDIALADLDSVLRQTAARVAVGPLPDLVVDVSLIARVFQNLIDNALKFRDPDQAPSVSISAKRHKSKWVFAVDDDGIGLPPEQRERVFAPFARMHGRREYPGRGMGLPIVRRIIERHGGETWADQAPGGGTRICFSLPEASVE